MTATEIIYAIREKLKAYTDDTKYTDAYIFFLINLKRALYIRREYNQQQRKIDQEVAQTICMELEEVDSSVCPECQELSSNECSVIRTVLKLPNTIELHNRQTILKISSIGVFDKPFSLIDINRMPYIGESRYENKFIYAAYHSNGYIYLKSSLNFIRTLTHISVTALFENPDDISKFQCSPTDNTPCFDFENTNYPIEGWMADVVISDIVQELSRLKGIPEDNTNNAKDDNN
jgi:hypothetical protein